MTWQFRWRAAAMDVAVGFAWFGLVGAGLVWVGLAAAQPADQDENQLPAGLVAEYATQSFGTVRRIEGEILVTPGISDRRLARERLRAVWRGKLWAQSAGEYRLSVYAAGRVRVVLRGQMILQGEQDDPQWSHAPPIELPFGYHDLEVAYEQTSGPRRLQLFWRGPQFAVEPITRQFLFHESTDRVDDRYARGEHLVRELRCAACHEIPGEPVAVPAPPLETLAGQTRPDWVRRHLDFTVADRRDTAMPDLGLTERERDAVVAFLAPPLPAAADQLPPWKTAKKPSGKSGGKSQPAIPSAEAGRELFLTVGCLACHAWHGLGGTTAFGGGDLTNVHAKRPATFFERWLSAPQEINPRHRMPQFELTAEEQRSLALFLRSDATSTAPASQPVKDARRPEAAGDELVALGKSLVESRGCRNCHVPLGQAQPAARRVLTPPTQDSAAGGESCLDAPSVAKQRPGYHLPAADRAAVQTFLTTLNGQPLQPAAHPDGHRLLAESNCLACHARGAAAGLAPRLPDVARRDEQLAPLLPALTPPPLITVGDKLHRDALLAAIRRQSVHRDYLRVRMPKFNLTDSAAESLAEALIEADRLPPGYDASSPAAGRKLDAKVLLAVGGRLVTPAGFGCTSCHQVGDQPPAKAPLNARGPNLTMLGNRLRSEWFDRFVRNPLRMIPRMEMPSVQLPIRGVLADDLEMQLAAVWNILNEQGFQPPRPEPVRILRRTGLRERAERAVVATDVIRHGEQTWIKPLLIGLPNRHNFLFDLEHGRLLTWTLGDAAHLHTEGKSWFWELGGPELMQPAADEIAELQIVRDGVALAPRRIGQFVTEFDAVRHLEGALEFQHRLYFGAAENSQPVHVTQTFAPAWASDGSPHESPHESPHGADRHLVIAGLRPGDELLVRLFSSQSLSEKGADPLRRPKGQTPFRTGSQDSTRRIEPDRREAVWELGGVQVESPAGCSMLPDGTVRVAADVAGIARLTIHYRTSLPTDSFPVEPPQPPSPPPAVIDAVPGFTVVRLPLSSEMMPTGFAWGPGGELYVASLKGRVWRLHDTNQDGLEDLAQPVSDDLAAPYGLAAGDGYLDVVAKFGLLRLSEPAADGAFTRMTLLASGWGHTADYHDWAIGLPRDEQGRYYVALPCEQDNRSLAAAHLRGQFLRLDPRSPTADDPRRFSVTPLTAGHRFPMGVARNRAGLMFVTDNQGNYNPFNELNFIQPGARFGFINSTERQPGFAPPLTPPAIDIPHPWTRSVNGICFLESDDLSFGPFEGQLIGCEYDSRRLVRMSIQQVDGQPQGAAYPFSLDEPRAGPPLLGPVVCGASPRGELYVGGMRDSGWGGGNNVGEVLRLKLDPAALPAGIAVVQATPRGLVVQFTRPVDRGLAAVIGNYSVASYTRVSTPAYGGPDADRRQERIESVAVSPDARQVELELPELRAGYVYELRLQPLTEGGEFFPAEAHYTMRRVPRE